MSASRGRYLSELRRSNAAGIHRSRPNRSLQERLAIQEEIDMGNVIYPNFNREPTKDDLEAIEGGYLDDEVFYDDDEDYWDEEDYAYDE